MKLFSRWLELLNREPQTGQLRELQAICPFELIECSAFDVPKQLETLREAGNRLGFSPVILGDVECTRACVEQLSASKANVSETITKANLTDVNNWLSERRQQEEYDPNEVLGNWPSKAQPPNKLNVHELLTGNFQKKPLSPFYIAKIPTPNSWEIPAYLQFGGWNSCPEPEYQVAIAKHWHKLYGAQVVTMAGDMVEYFVERPPNHQPLAEQLAIEQFSFCLDIVEQGAGTIRDLAAILLKSKFWFFWWD